MAEDITIPSPALTLNAPVPSPDPTTVKNAARRPQPSPNNASNASDSIAPTKRKQSKSRNGCITCKTKRLKCDETKPTCQQCAKRSVVCGGYKKNFKWRPFEETSFTGKALGKPNKLPSPPMATPMSLIDSPIGSDDSQHTIMNPFQETYSSNSTSSGSMLMQVPLPTCSYAEPSYTPFGDSFAPLQTSPYMLAPRTLPVDRFDLGAVESANSVFETDSIDTGTLSQNTASSSVSSGQSPRLVDLLLPGTDLNMQPEEFVSFRSQYESFYQPIGFTPTAHPTEEDDVEEIPRNFNFDHDSWVTRLSSPTPSSSSSSSSGSREYPLLAQPQFSMTSPEMLTRRFDRDTCGILSVKDGPTENPWRTLVWPLARDCPALYHAIASMTSFHQSRDSPSMRIQGIDHMSTSVHALASRLENMRVDAAISTTLVLAFAESWDSHISTGINHIKGAKILIDRALMRHNQVPVQGEEYSRLKFLCNAWIYMDVIARLTSADDDESNDFDLVSDSIYMNGQTDTHLDPLMGCATTLFPIIGRVANLVRRVRRTNSNSPTIISQAMALKSQLEDWIPPTFIEIPEDETSSPHDSLKTASAYKYATLLYLHQAVPEVPSLPSAVLATKVLCELATVMPMSRSTIVHIYPLMAAGCEVMDQENRDFVRQRWDQMSTRMKLGILEKCQEVTKEVWRRRDADAYASELLANERSYRDSMASMTSPLKRNFGSISEHVDNEEPFSWLDLGTKRRALDRVSFFEGPQAFPIKAERAEGRQRPEAGTESLELEFTVKGRLHWLGVMKDWKWEVLLG